MEAQHYVDWNTKMRSLSDRTDLLGLCALLDIPPREIGVSDAVLYDAATLDARRVALVSVAKEVLDCYRLGLVTTSNGFKIVPLESWNDAVRRIMYVINGLGEFLYKGVNHFLTSGPYTARQAVLSHLHYVKEYYNVYGGSTPIERFNHALSRRN